MKGQSLLNPGVTAQPSHLTVTVEAGLIRARLVWPFLQDETELALVAEHHTVWRQWYEYGYPGVILFASPVFPEPELMGELSHTAMGQEEAATLTAHFSHVATSVQRALGIETARLAQEQDRACWPALLHRFFAALVPPAVLDG